MEKLRTSDYRGNHWPEEDEDSYPLYVTFLTLWPRLILLAAHWL